jgi:hypothetical protein
MWAASVLSLLVALTPAPEVAATLTEVTTVAAAAVNGTEVLSSRDIDKIMALESQKQLAGCNASDDCLAEVAGALGARLVVFGELGALDDQLILTLNLYDAEAARSVARQLVQGSGAAAVSEAIPVATRSLLEAHLATVTARPVRVLVMNIQTTVSTVVDNGAPAVATGGSLLGPIGLVTIGVGGAVAVVGGIVGLVALDTDTKANAADTTQREAKDLYDARNGQALAANLLFGAAAVVAGTGATLWLLGME